MVECRNEKGERLRPPFAWLTNVSKGGELAAPLLAGINGRDQRDFVVFTGRGLHVIFAAHKPAARRFPGLPHLGQQSASALAGEHDSRPPGFDVASDHMGDDGTVKLTVHAPHYKYVDSVLTGD